MRQPWAHPDLLRGAVQQATCRACSDDGNLGTSWQHDVNPSNGWESPKHGPTKDTGEELLLRHCTSDGIVMDVRIRGIHGVHLTAPAQVHP